MKKLRRIIFALVAVMAMAGVSGAQVITDPPAGGGGTTTIASGTTPITAGATTQLCFNDAAFISCGDAGLTYNKTTDFLSVAGGIINGSVSTAGRSILTIADTISGGSATSNFLNITGTFPTVLTATTVGARMDFATAGSSAFTNQGLNVNLNAGYTGASATQALAILNGVAGTGGNIGGNIAASVTTTGNNIGISSTASQSSTWNVGIRSTATNATNSPALNVGVAGFGNSATANAGGAFYLGAAPTPPTAPTVTNSALYADNQAIAGNIVVAADNGAATSTTAASANITILDGAQMRLGNMGLTSATMTPTIVSEARTVTHSYAWTNAMVVALGAALTGDITVATLPAKTRVDAAYIVIDTAAGGPTTLTVSCGDASGGTPFINYVKPGDAKAAANTFYGDNITGTETGASLFSTFFIPNYIPSYTATTLVTCHFIATVTNLNTTTTSTGRLILTTTLLP